MTNTSFSSDRAVGGAASGAKNAPAATAAAAAGSRPITVEDALSFLQMVKEAFKERHPDKYWLFMRLMNDFKNERISSPEVASAAKALFQDNPDLALRFNTFLPKSDRIQVGVAELAACLIRDVNLDDGDGSSGGGH